MQSTLSINALIRNLCNMCPIHMHWSVQIRCCDLCRQQFWALQVVVLLLLFPVARGLLTFIRSTPLKKVIPVDQSIQMHKFLAYCCKCHASWSLLYTHCVCVCVCVCVRACARARALSCVLL